MTNIPSKEERDLRKRFGIQLEKARKKKGLTQEALAGKIGKGPQTVSNWENGYYYPKEIDTLLKIANILECDPDFLLGRLDESTHNVHFACAFTGLSEKAIEKITKAKPYRSLTAATLSRLIETEGFSGLMLAYRQFLDSADKLKESSLERPQYNINDIETVVLSRDQATRYFMRTVADEMMFICEEEFKKQYMAAMENERKRIEEESERNDDTDNV